MPAERRSLSGIFTIGPSPFVCGPRGAARSGLVPVPGRGQAPRRRVVIEAMWFSTCSSRFGDSPPDKQNPRIVCRPGGTMLPGWSDDASSPRQGIVLPRGGWRTIGTIGVGEGVTRRGAREQHERRVLRHFDLSFPCDASLPDHRNSLFSDGMRYCDPAVLLGSHLTRKHTSITATERCQ